MRVAVDADWSIRRWRRAWTLPEGVWVEWFFTSFRA